VPDLRDLRYRILVERIVLDPLEAAGNRYKSRPGIQLLLEIIETLTDNDKLSSSQTIPLTASVRAISGVRRPSRSDFAFE
jgi:hypothetical protein